MSLAKLGENFVFLVLGQLNGKVVSFSCWLLTRHMQMFLEPERQK